MPRRRKDHFTINEIIERLARAEELRIHEMEMQAERELQRMLAEQWECELVRQPHNIGERAA